MSFSARLLAGPDDGVPSACNDGIDIHRTPTATSRSDGLFVVVVPTCVKRMQPAVDFGATDWQSSCRRFAGLIRRTWLPPIKINEKCYRAESLTSGSERADEGVCSPREFGGGEWVGTPRPSPRSGPRIGASADHFSTAHLGGPKGVVASEGLVGLEGVVARCGRLLPNDISASTTFPPKAKTKKGLSPLLGRSPTAWLRSHSLRSAAQIVE